MNRVVIESPFAGDVEGNIEYARKAVSHSVHRGEAPIASHLLFTQPGILDDTKPDERKLGMEAGWAWFVAAQIVAFYVDRGISSGMIHGFEHALLSDADIVVRSIVTGQELYVPIEIELPGTSLGEEAHKRNLASLHIAATAVVSPDASFGHSDPHQSQSEFPST